MDGSLRQKRSMMRPAGAKQPDAHKSRPVNSTITTEVERVEPAAGEVVAGQLQSKKTHGDGGEGRVTMM